MNYIVINLIDQINMLTAPTSDDDEDDDTLSIASTIDTMDADLSADILYWDLYI
jgi:hypothetical protein